MRIFSSAFEDGDTIPAQYTCDGKNISPPLTWQDVPAQAKFLTIICDDPDAPGGVWDHWLLFNLPATHTGLEEEFSRDFDPLPGVGHGLNSWKHACYDGPCPSNGTHRYYFKLYALDSRINLKPGASKADILRAMDGHILAQASIKGLYSRD